MAKCLEIAADWTAFYSLILGLIIMLQIRNNVDVWVNRWKNAKLADGESDRQSRWFVALRTVLTKKTIRLWLLINALEADRKYQNNYRFFQIPFLAVYSRMVEYGGERPL